MLRIGLLLALLSLCHGAEVPDPDPARFAKAIDAFDAQDAKSPPEKGGIVFAGSSSIRLLDLPKVFPGLDALNRGFGGAHISDMNHYLERVLLRYEPSRVIFYCGTNDVWDKKPPEQVEADFNELRQRLFERSPEAELIVLAIRPSPARKSILAIERAMNERFRGIAEADERITYLSGSADRFIRDDETFDHSLFVEDGLHMSAKGYAIWKELLSPHLPKTAPSR